jgi:hypothetical protein
LRRIKYLCGIFRDGDELFPGTAIVAIFYRAVKRFFHHKHRSKQITPEKRAAMETMQYFR